MTDIEKPTRKTHPKADEIVGARLQESYKARFEGTVHEIELVVGDDLAQAIFHSFSEVNLSKSQAEKIASDLFRCTDIYIGSAITLSFRYVGTSNYSVQWDVSYEINK